MGGADRCLPIIKNTQDQEALEKFLEVIRMLCGEYENKMFVFLGLDIKDRAEKLQRLLSSSLTSKDAKCEETYPQRLQRTQDSEECVACLNEIAVWEFPCKHLVYCKSCMRTAKKKAAKEAAKAGKAKTFLTCPLCRGSGPARRAVSVK